MHRIRHHSGFTLVELMVCVMIFSTIALIASNWINKPMVMYDRIAQLNMQTIANNAANGLVADLKTADPNSIPWSALLYDQISFSQLRYNFQNPTVAASSVTVSYTFTPAGNGLGTLMRTVDGKNTVLLSNVVAPTSTSPLIQKDTTVINGQPLYNVLVFSFTYKPLGVSTPISVLKRIAVTG